MDLSLFATNIEHRLPGRGGMVTEHEKTRRDELRASAVGSSGPQRDGLGVFDPTGDRRRGSLWAARRRMVVLFISSPNWTLVPGVVLMRPALFLLDDIDAEAGP